MKKTPFILAILLLTFQSVHAQLSEQKRHFVSLNAGVSVPSGLYASVSGDEDESGFAKTGYNYSIEGAFYLRPYVAIAATTGTFANNVDKDAFKNSFNEDLESLGLNGSSSGSISAWRNTYFMVGPYLSVPFSKLTFDLKLMGGLMTTYSPEIDITVIPYSTGDPIRAYSESSAKASFGFTTGLSARYHFNNRWAIRAYADLMAAKPKIDRTTYTYYQGTKTRSSDSYKQPITVFNLGLGVAFHFVK